MRAQYLEEGTGVAEGNPLWVTEREQLMLEGDEDG